MRSHLGNNGVLAEAVSINQEGVTVRFGKICIAPSTFWLLGVNIGNVLALGANWPLHRKGWACYRQIGDNLCSVFTLYILGGRVMRQGPGIGQGPTNSVGLYIHIGPGGGPGPTHGGSLMSKLNFWAVFPYSWAETVPGLQLNQKSNVPLGSGKEVRVLTQDRCGDSNSRGGMGIVD